MSSLSFDGAVQQVLLKKIMLSVKKIMLSVHSNSKFYS